MAPAKNHWVCKRVANDDKGVWPHKLCNGTNYLSNTVCRFCDGARPPPPWAADRQVGSGKGKGKDVQTNGSDNQGKGKGKGKGKHLGKSANPSRPELLDTEVWSALTKEQRRRYLAGKLTKQDAVQLAKSCGKANAPASRTGATDERRLSGFFDKIVEPRPQSKDRTAEEALCTLLTKSARASAEAAEKTQRIQALNSAIAATSCKFTKTALLEKMEELQKQLDEINSDGGDSASAATEKIAYCKARDKLDADRENKREYREKKTVEMEQNSHSFLAAVAEVKAKLAQLESEFLQRRDAAREKWSQNNTESDKLADEMRVIACARIEAAEKKIAEKKTTVRTIADAAATTVALGSCQQCKCECGWHDWRGGCSCAPQWSGGKYGGNAKVGERSAAARNTQRSLPATSAELQRIATHPRRATHGTHDGKLDKGRRVRGPYAAVHLRDARADGGRHYCLPGQASDRIAVHSCQFTARSSASAGAEADRVPTQGTRGKRQRGEGGKCDGIRRKGKRSQGVTKEASSRAEGVQAETCDASEKIGDVGDCAHADRGCQSTDGCCAALQGLGALVGQAMDKARGYAQRICGGIGSARLRRSIDVLNGASGCRAAKLRGTGQRHHGTVQCDLPMWVVRAAQCRRGLTRVQHGRDVCILSGLRGRVKIRTGYGTWQRGSGGSWQYRRPFECQDCGRHGLTSCRGPSVMDGRSVSIGGCCCDKGACGLRMSDTKRLQHIKNDGGVVTLEGDGLHGDRRGTGRSEGSANATVGKPDGCAVGYDLQTPWGECSEIQKTNQKYSAGGSTTLPYLYLLECYLDPKQRYCQISTVVLCLRAVYLDVFWDKLIYGKSRWLNDCWFLLPLC